MPHASEKGFYSEENVPQQEIERLQKFEFPNQVSAKILSESDLKGKVVADFGSGPNAELGKFITSKEAKYIPVDLRTEMLKNLKQDMESSGEQFYGFAADVKKLPLANNSIDISHQRFVLMHLSPEDQLKAIQELNRVTRQQIDLIEYNWRTIESSTDQEKLARFLELSFKLMEKAKIDPYAGEKILELSKAINPGAVQKTFKREEGDYTKELIMLCRTGSAMAKARLKDDQLASDLGNLAEELEQEHIKFAPAEIVVVEIKK